MARNGSGTYSVPNSFSANTTIESAKVNQNFSDMGSEITGSLPRNGEAGMTGQFKAADGTVGAPGISFASDTDTGFYRSGANTITVAGTLTNGTVKYDDFPAGTITLFMQTSAPTGWTKSLVHNDKAIRIVSGTASSGGTTAFSSVFASRTILEANLPVHSHTFSGTTSTDGAHTHTYTMPPAEFGVNTGGTNAPRGTNSTQNTGSSGSHNHTFSGTTSSVGSGTAMDFAVQYVDVIAASKDA